MLNLLTVAQSKQQCKGSDLDIPVDDPLPNKKSDESGTMWSSAEVIQCSLEAYDDFFRLLLFFSIFG